jgi:hypothetical protein
MRAIVIALTLGLAGIGAASAEVSVGVGIQLPGVSIGVNVPAYPRLVAVPGYPVYYAPGLDGNFFFYDGLYWVYDADRWYSSAWYNGPWRFVEPAFVPLFVLRVPVLYYRHPPPYFAGWRRDVAPRWGEHWGRDWEAGHRGWNHWNRAAVPRRAPLPGYQRDFSGDRYPRAEEQRALRDRNYRYAPRDRAVRAQDRGDAGRAAAPRSDRPPQAARPESGARRTEAPRAPAAAPRPRTAEPAPRGERERPRSEPAGAREPAPHGGRGAERPPDGRGR